MAEGIGQRCFQPFQLPLATVDGTQPAGMFHTVEVVAGGQQAVNIESRNTFQRQHDGVGTQKALELPVVCSTLGSTFQGIPQGNVQLIGLIPAISRAPVRHLAPKRFQGIDQPLLLVFVQQPVGGAHPYAVMGGDKVQVGGAHLRRRHAHQPGFQMAAITGHQGVDQQGRQ